MRTIYKFNAITIEQAKDKKRVFYFLDEMRFDVKHTGNKSTRDRS